VIAADPGATTRAGGASWAHVAAAGTDPQALAGIVERAAADPRGFATDWRRALHTDDPGSAIRAAGTQAVLPSPTGQRVAQAWSEGCVRVALAGDPAMPERLVATSAQPPWLAIRGAVRRRDTPAVAIVGSRRASAYGRGIAAWLAEAAGAAGVHVVSGGAVGIDAAAHGAALDTDGGTTVVLGCGHDVAYPRPHAGPGKLFERVVDAGGALVSESLPHEPPRPWRVRSRNRLIAALVDVVVVVEGGSRSGSLVTATWAADYGITVLAVPGDVRAPGSGAPLRLLRDGAGVCGSPDDLLAALPQGIDRARDDVAGGAVPDGPATSGLVASSLPEAAAAVLAEAWPRPVTMADLAAQSNVAAGTLLAAITAAQVAGQVTRDLDGLRLCRDPHR